MMKQKGVVTASSWGNISYTFENLKNEAIQSYLNNVALCYPVICSFSLIMKYPKTGVFNTKLCLNSPQTASSLATVKDRVLVWMDPVKYLPLTLASVLGNGGHTGSLTASVLAEKPPDFSVFESDVQ